MLEFIYFVVGLLFSFLNDYLHYALSRIEKKGCDDQNERKTLHIQNISHKKGKQGFSEGELAAGSEIQLVTYFEQLNTINSHQLEVLDQSKGTKMSCSAREIGWMQALRDTPARTQQTTVI